MAMDEELTTIQAKLAQVILEVIESVRAKC